MHHSLKPKFSSKSTASLTDDANYGYVLSMLAAHFSDDIEVLYLCSWFHWM